MDWTKERRDGKGSSRYGPEKLPNYNTEGSFYHYQGLLDLGKSGKSFATGAEKFCCLSIQVLLWQTYVGKTTQRLSERILQHIPKKLCGSRPVLKPVKGDSAIIKHLKASPSCISDQLQQTGFTVLA